MVDVPTQTIITERGSSFLRGSHSGRDIERGRMNMHYIFGLVLLLLLLYPRGDWGVGELDVLDADWEVIN